MFFVDVNLDKLGNNQHPKKEFHHGREKYCPRSLRKSLHFFQIIVDINSLIHLNHWLLVHDDEFLYNQWNDLKLENKEYNLKLYKDYALFKTELVSVKGDNSIEYYGYVKNDLNIIQYERE